MECTRTRFVAGLFVENAQLDRERGGHQRNSSDLTIETHLGIVYKA